ncbi:MAG: hypothetical protein ACE5H2_04085, partial [Terriglobia bacterium]
MKEIFVVSGDWKLRALVRAELRERGYTARGYESLHAAAAELGSRAHFPAALVVDAADTDAAIAAQQIAAWATRLPVVLVLSAAQAAPPLPPKVCVLHRPLRI